MIVYHNKLMTDLDPI